MRRATDTTLENHLNRIISIHALHEENDPLYGANALLPAISIHALHEENDGDAVEDRADLRISIHALHEENDGDAVEDRADLRISIHALHEESDVLHRVHRHLQPISIHALHEESDRPRKRSTSGIVRFQSTLSMRRATLAFRGCLRSARFQSTLSMRRATRIRGDRAAVLVISIHALHEESDPPLMLISNVHAYFNPRSP